MTVSPDTTERLSTHPQEERGNRTDSWKENCPDYWYVQRLSTLMSTSLPQKPLIARACVMLSFQKHPLPKSANGHGES